MNVLFFEKKRKLKVKSKKKKITGVEVRERGYS